MRPDVSLKQLRSDLIAEMNNPNFSSPILDLLKTFFREKDKDLFLDVLKNLKADMISQNILQYLNNCFLQEITQPKLDISLLVELMRCGVDTQMRINSSWFLSKPITAFNIIMQQTPGTRQILLRNLFTTLCVLNLLFIKINNIIHTKIQQP